MIPAKQLDKRYGSTNRLYQLRNFLSELGYDMTPKKNGVQRLYTDEQIELLDALMAHIKSTGEMRGFPPHSQSLTNIENQVLLVSPNGQILPKEDKEREINPVDNEIYLDPHPLASDREQQIRMLDQAAQHRAAQNLAAFNLLTIDYMKHRDFSEPGLSEQVQQSEEALKQAFAVHQESPQDFVKKLLQRKRQAVR